MTQLLEPDHSLIANKRAAQRFLEMISPSPDDPQHPLPSERMDDRPLVRSVHSFVVRDDVMGRNDQALSKALIGSIDDSFAELARMNTQHRAAVLLQVKESDCILAEAIDVAEAYTTADWLPRRAFPIEPSFTIMYGHGGFPDRRPFIQWVWLLDSDVKANDRKNLVDRLASIGIVARADALLRVPGFYARCGAPVMVHARGLSASQGVETVRYPAAVVRPAA